MKLSKPNREFHRKLAAKCFNDAWEYIEKKNRSKADERQMLHLAHASRYHWGLIGAPVPQAVGDWQLSRIYANLGDRRLAVEFAKASLAICKRNHLSDIIHTANEGMARAYATSKEYDKARRYLDSARRQLDLLKLDREDRQIYADQLRETEKLIRNHSSC
jgi:tetratricopeptide (TPR) repeat protein